MAEGKLNRYWILITILLATIAVTGGITAWVRYSPGQTVEISMPQNQELLGEIYVGGAISNPGYYSLKTGDSIDAIIQAAGGTNGSADLNQLKLYIPESGEEPSQKVDINRAESWLLQALPGIGETLAQRIIDYRNQNGPFRNINELMQVEGIGATTYEQIKHLITVADE